LTNYFEIKRNSRQTAGKEEQRNFTINGKNYRNARRRSYGYYGSGEC